MTSNGSAYRSELLAKVLRAAAASRGARFVQTSSRGWAKGRLYACADDRARAIKPWTGACNVCCPHFGVEGLTPWRRVLGNDT